MASPIWIDSSKTVRSKLVNGDAKPISGSEWLAGCTHGKKECNRNRNYD